MRALVARATVTALHTLLQRAADDETSTSGSTGAKGSSSSAAGSGARSPTASTSKAASKTSAAKGATASPKVGEEDSWIFHNTDLVVSICICGVVLTIIGLILVWWWLKRKHTKAMAAREAAEAAEEGQAGSTGGDISVFKGIGPDGPDAEQQQALDSMYPHFGASQPNVPTLASSYPPGDNDYADEKLGSGGGYPPGHGGAGGYSLGAITERTEETEGGGSLNDRGLPRAGTSPGQQEDSYYYNDEPDYRSAGGSSVPASLQLPQPAHLQAGPRPDDRESMYSMQDSTRYA